MLALGKGEMKLLISLVILIQAVGCMGNHQTQLSNANHKASDSSAQPMTSPSVESSNSTDNPIRKVDFRNFTYDHYPDWGDISIKGKKIILRNGEMDVDVSFTVNAPRGFWLADAEYGDVTGDEIEEAVVTLGIWSPGTARHHVVFVYGMLNNQPRKLWVYETGDRAWWGYRRAYVENGKLLVERYKPDTIISDGEKIELNSSGYYTRDYYEWRRGNFKKIKTEEYPNDAESGKPYVRKPA